MTHLAYTRAARMTSFRCVYKPVSSCRLRPLTGLSTPDDSVYTDTLLMSQAPSSDYSSPHWIHGNIWCIKSWNPVAGTTLDTQTNFHYFLGNSRKQSKFNTYSINYINLMEIKIIHISELSLGIVTAIHS